MKILFIHQYFKTPEEGGGIRSYYMCKALIAKGHQVVLISSHNNKKYLFKEVEGIKVHYLPVFYDNKLGFAGRVFAFIKFLGLSTVKALKIPDVDCVYTSSSPLTVGLTGILLKKTKKVRFIFEVMDLWPEAPIQMGFIRNPVLKKILYLLEKAIYKSSDLVIAASPGMEEGVKRVAPQVPTRMIPNMSDCSYFSPRPKNENLIRKYEVKGKLVCCYTGAVGLSNSLDNLLEIALYLERAAIHDIHFLIAGEGAHLSKLKEMAAHSRLSNVSFLGYLPKDSIREIYNVSNINLIFFSSEKILETNSPNKFFDGLAAGLPAIININGWIKELCEENNCGKFFNRHKPEDFLKITEELRNTDGMLKMYSKNARKLAETRFNKDIILKEFSEIFDISEEEKVITNPLRP